MKRFLCILTIVAHCGAWADDGSAVHIKEDVLAKYAECLAKFGDVEEVDRVPVAMQIAKLAERFPEASGEMQLSDDELRRMKLVALVQSLEIVESLQIPAFDFSQAPHLKATPPAKSGVDVGASPLEIKDLALRAEYEAAIRTTQLKVKVYTEQQQLKTARDSLVLNLKIFFKNFSSKENQAGYRKEIERARLQKSTREELLSQDEAGLPSSE